MNQWTSENCSSQIDKRNSSFLFVFPIIVFVEEYYLKTFSAAIWPSQFNEEHLSLHPCKTAYSSRYLEMRFSPLLSFSFWFSVMQCPDACFNSINEQRTRRWITPYCIALLHSEHTSLSTFDFDRQNGLLKRQELGLANQFVFDLSGSSSAFRRQYSRT